MKEQEYVRKYMLKDIVKRNLKFFWLIVLCAILCASFLGYKRYKEYVRYFEYAAMKGTVNQYKIDFYTGNIQGTELSMRAKTMIRVMTSQMTHEELLKISGYDMTYETFLDFVHCDTEGSDDSVFARFDIPWGNGDIELLTDEQAKEFIKFYTQAVQNVCDRLMGQDVVYLLNVGEGVEHTYEGTPEQRADGKKAIVKNAFIGGVIGFIIPIVLITFLYLLDGTLKTAEEIAFCSDKKLLAKVKLTKKQIDLRDLERVKVYFELYAKKTPYKLNLLMLTKGGEPIKEDLVKILGDKYSVQMSDLNASKAEAYNNSLQCDETILVAGTHLIKEDAIEEVVREMSLYGIISNGVIVYESCK